MKNLKFIAIIIAFFSISACCSKKGACPTLQFSSVKLVGFDPKDIDSGIRLNIYQPNTNFTQVVNTVDMKAEPTSDANVYILNTGVLGIDYDYGVSVPKLSKDYKVSNYAGTKVACGKCFLRSNNQFGYEMTAYSVNNRSQGFEGFIQINK